LTHVIFYWMAFAFRLWVFELQARTPRIDFLDEFRGIYQCNRSQTARLRTGILNLIDGYSEEFAKNQPKVEGGLTTFRWTCVSVPPHLKIS
jgi:hypothetical protein